MSRPNCFSIAGFGCNFPFSHSPRVLTGCPDGSEIFFTFQERVTRKTGFTIPSKNWLYISDLILMQLHLPAFCSYQSKRIYRFSFSLYQFTMTSFYNALPKIIANRITQWIRCTYGRTVCATVHAGCRPSFLSKTDKILDDAICFVFLCPYDVRRKFIWIFFLLILNIKCPYWQLLRNEEEI